MLGTRLRNGKQRMLYVLPLGIILILGIYILRDTHIKLTDARGNWEKCQQHEESLSAQLQVVYEHKSRLEKSVQLEKTQHKKTKDDLQAKVLELQDGMEKEKQEAANRINSLQQQHKMLQIQTEDLQEDLNKVQQSNIDLLKEKQQLQSNYDGQSELAKQKDNELEDQKAQVSKLQYNMDTLNKQISAKDQRITELETRLKLCQSKPSETIENLLKPIKLYKPDTLPIVLQPHEGDINLKLNPVAQEAIKETEQKPEKTNGELKLEVPPQLQDVPKEEKREVLQEPDQNNQLKPVVPQSEERQGAGDKETGGLQRQLQRPDEQEQQMPNVENGRNLNQKMDEEDGVGVIKVPIGLEQQENGGDQDPDNIEEEEGAAAGEQRHPREGKEFDEADFDQVEDGGNAVKQHEGIMVAPH